MRLFLEELVEEVEGLFVLGKVEAKIYFEKV